MPFNPPEDTQPLPNPTTAPHRTYIPATWAEPGTGDGHPKLSGGFEIDTRTGAPAPRSLNRAGQHYAQPAAQLEANRRERAAEEWSNCSIQQGIDGEIEIRTPSGNNYDINPDGTDCDCPDRMKLDRSGHTDIHCKHGYAVLLAIEAAGSVEALPWSVQLYAQRCGLSIRAVEHQCHVGAIPATKVLGNWEIAAATAPDAIAAYTANMWPYEE